MTLSLISLFFIMEQLVKLVNSSIGKYLYEAYLKNLMDEQKNEIQETLGI